MYIDMNEETISSVIGAMFAQIQTLQHDNEWLSDRLAAETRRANAATTAARVAEKEFDRDELEEFLKEVEDGV